MLQKRPEDLERVRLLVLKSRWAAVRRFEEKFGNSIVDFNHQPGTLVLVRNSKADKDLSKHNARYLGPMVVVRRSRGGAYMLSELDGSVSRLRFAAFRVIPYAPRDIRRIPVHSLVDLSPEQLDDIENGFDSQPRDEDELQLEDL
ncbi:hypothetical protein M413DRAFT_79143 [Hebeloma cylindrosporum]|uniref:Uncharacterized protein n=1 Tax=Hebeloma cylindrosporum TaxID=76867 RepID=A0A0C2XCM4_HEBCY|nr:hypothetical protein M413DRAFT_79143 [Hebeloma cylindrosporum h7]